MMESSTNAPTDSVHPPTKRPRSVSGEAPLPVAKTVKTHANHLQINYLARQYSENIPLVSTEDTLPSILRLISEYDGVLHRHESIAGNLGACPLGPILIKRFERLFDGPPKVLKSHGKDGTTVTWLDVVEFARNKPEQFNLEKTRNGVRVCQFYTKQSRVEISEEDYVLISSGMPQKLIPPQPIMEDEEKELGALEILEKSLSQIVQLADQVSARARQLNHRLKNRKSAIISRRESELQHGARSTSPPSWGDVANGGTGIGEQNRNGGVHGAHSPAGGFTAVNSRQGDTLDGSTENAPHSLFHHPNTDNVTIINGTSIKGASPGTRAELMKKFFTTADRNARGWGSEEDTRRSPGASGRSSSSTRLKSKTLENGDYATIHGPSAVPIPNTPTSLLPHLKHSQVEKEDGGPYKAEMIARMEQLHRGERVLPPCDRCRRLHMDCLKNLTACQGCTKKHAKCSWKEVTEEELRTSQNETSGTDHEDVHDHDGADDDDQMRETPESDHRRRGKESERPREMYRNNAAVVESGSETEAPRQSPKARPVEAHRGRHHSNGFESPRGTAVQISKPMYMSRSTDRERRAMGPADDADDDADAAIARAIATVSPPAANQPQALV